MTENDKNLPWLDNNLPPPENNLPSEPSAGPEEPEKGPVKEFTAADRARMARLFDPEATSGLIWVKVWLTEAEFTTLRVYGEPSTVIQQLIRRKLAADPEIPWKLGGQSR